MVNNQDYLDEGAARKEIVKWGKEIYNKGLVNGTGGNLSIKISPEIILCTPSGWSLGNLTEDSITKASIYGEIYEGLKPTKELFMHVAVYKERQDISAIAHTHSINAVTYACVMKPGQQMPLYIPSVVAKVGIVEVTPFHLPASEELGRVAAEGIKESQAVLLQNHGVLSVGKTLEDAIGVAFEVEDNAKIYFLSNGKAEPLEDSVLLKIKGTYK